MLKSPSKGNLLYSQYKDELSVEIEKIDKDSINLRDNWQNKFKCDLSGVTYPTFVSKWSWIKLRYVRKVVMNSPVITISNRAAKMHKLNKTFRVLLPGISNKDWSSAYATNDGLAAAMESFYGGSSEIFFDFETNVRNSSCLIIGFIFCTMKGKPTLDEMYDFALESICKGIADYTVNFNKKYNLGTTKETQNA
jgi:hypothetical protein